MAGVAGIPAGMRIPGTPGTGCRTNMLTPCHKSSQADDRACLGTMTLIISGPEGQRKLAGGVSHRKAVSMDPAPRRGAGSVIP